MGNQRFGTIWLHHWGNNVANILLFLILCHAWHKISETLINLAIDNDCLEINESNNSLNLEFKPSEFKIIYELFKKNNYIPTNSEVAYIPETSIMLDIKMFKDVTRLIESLEELDDVQNVYSNFDIDDKLLDTALTI